MTLPTQFLWCYWQGGAVADELRWSMRSVEQNVVDPTESLIIGDRPSWYFGPHIDCPRIKVAKQDRMFTVGLQDVLHKLRVAVESPLVNGHFILMMDDVYLVNPVTVEDLCVPRYDPMEVSNRNTWRKLRTKTIQYLRANHHTTYNYATHLPYSIVKAHLRFVLNGIADDNPLLWEVIYGNRFYRSPKPARPFGHRVQTRLTMRELDAVAEVSTCINNDHFAWDDTLREWLSSRFPDPAFTERFQPQCAKLNQP